MFQTNQCVMPIFEPLASTGSGSCSSRTKLCVPGGTCDHCSAGETAAGPAACVYLSGMTPPSCQAFDVINSGGAAGPRACCAASDPANTPVRSEATARSRTFLFSAFLLMGYLLVKESGEGILV